ncbi:MAG: hypothetical protein IJ781_03700 [Atopobiaceae bacterium]|nr:hypothetical protein [Atopobiaceae bacterium]
MRSVDERVTSVRRRERGRSLKTRLLGMVGACALVCLALVLSVVGSDVTAPPSAGQGLYGASIFGETVGGYVLVAIVSFIAASTLTLACLRHRAHRDKTPLPVDQENDAPSPVDSRPDLVPTTKER